jgi:ubiquinone/menaquinone biosynthesis C-methylase UbiE
VTISAEADIKQEVRQFYDQVGWQRVGDCCYQNARYEDLRPVSRAYIRRCHLRVLRHLKSQGRFLLDAGSGPIQYPEYLEYSKGFDYRVCADLSMVALQEARGRIGDHGLYVVSDVANLPFTAEVFEGVISLHTLQHLPEDEYVDGYGELFRVLAGSSSAVVVNRWRSSILMNLLSPILWLMGQILFLYRRATGKPTYLEATQSQDRKVVTAREGTFIHRHGAAWLKRMVGVLMPLEIYVWRSISTPFLRIMIHRRLGGRWILKFIYWLEEQAPRFFGEYGQYPLIVIRKP